MTTSTGPAERAFAYHRRTKHHPQRFARSLGYLDWDNQPEPFRTYEGAPRCELPLAADGVSARYGEVFTAGRLPPRPLDVDSLAAFLELALGLTAWKEYGSSRWALRSDPSSGNLHPTEGYLVLPERAGLGAGLHHYLSRDHLLEHRCRLAPPAAAELEALLPAGGFLAGVSSIHWREAWKYGERAFRYCQHDAGHVLATLRFAAAALGWTARLLEGLGSANVAGLLGLDRELDTSALHRLDREHPVGVLVVAPSTTVAPAERIGDGRDLVRLAAGGTWAGIPNALSDEHVDWEVVDEVAEATLQPCVWSEAAPSRAPASFPATEVAAGEAGLAAAAIIRGRRSAVALDGRTGLSRRRFYGMLERLLPTRQASPWDVLPWEPQVHLALFVHRVEDLAPGLYLLERAPDVHEAFARQLGEGALWKRPDGCPEHLELYAIGEADYRRTAASVSCGQEIAGDGAFSLGMLARFREPIEAGAFWYRRLFWETGVIGQVLYLEAEAAGLRGTGIGCFFDDEVHKLVGLEDERFQSLYHFTVGGPVEDTRLVTHPAYAHLARRAAQGSRSSGADSK